MAIAEGLRVDRMGVLRPARLRLRHRRAVRRRVLPALRRVRRHRVGRITEVRVLKYGQLQVRPSRGRALRAVLDEAHFVGCWTAARCARR